jgi:hypothetical protein
VTEQTCLFCGVSLVDRRSDARYCGSSCRTVASRLRRLLSGSGAGGYANTRARGSTRSGKGAIAARKRLLGWTTSCIPRAT